MSTAYEHIILNCPIHNLHIQQVNLLKHVPIGERLQCERCKLCNPTHISEAMFQWETHKKTEIQYRNCEYEKCMQKIEDLLTGFDHLKKTFNEQIEFSINLFQKAKQDIMDQHMIIINKINSMDDQLTIGKLQHIAEILSEKSKITHIELQAYFSDKNIKDMLEMITKCKVSICELKGLNIYFQDIFDAIHKKMKAIDTISIKSQLQHSLAIAFNYNNTIMAQGFINIEIQNFNQGELNFKQTLYGHTEKITFLTFCKSENILVSGSQDKTVIIWKEINHQFQSINTLSIKDQITGLLIRNNQIIVSTYKGKVQIWQRSNFGFQECEILQEFMHPEGCIYSMCINDPGTILATCGNDMKMRTWNNCNGWWTQGNSIQFTSQGCRVAFVGVNEVVWQGTSGKCFYYKINEPYKLDQKMLDDETQDSLLFPSIFCNTVSILLQKHNKYIYLIKTEQQSLKVLHKIECKTMEIYGTITSDGQYLVYNDTQEKKLKILKFNYTYLQ